jgi:hypothetical protein
MPDQAAYCHKEMAGIHDVLVDRAVISLKRVPAQIASRHIPFDSSHRAEYEYVIEKLRNPSNKKVVGLQSCNATYSTCACNIAFFASTCAYQDFLAHVLEASHSTCDCIFTFC